MIKINITKEIGLPAALEQCAEECTELAHAALKLARKYRNENPTPRTEETLISELEEELADVILCTKVIMEELEISRGHITRTIASKRKRWETRILAMQTN